METAEKAQTKAARRVATDEARTETTHRLETASTQVVASAQSQSRRLAAADRVPALGCVGGVCVSLVANAAARMRAVQRLLQHWSGAESRDNHGAKHVSTMSGECTYNCCVQYVGDESGQASNYE